MTTKSSINNVNNYYNMYITYGLTVSRNADNTSCYVQYRYGTSGSYNTLISYSSPNTNEKYPSQLQYLPNTTSTTLSIRFYLDSSTSTTRCYVGNFVLYGYAFPTDDPTKSPTNIPTQSPSTSSPTSPTLPPSSSSTTPSPVSDGQTTSNNNVDATENTAESAAVVSIEISVGVWVVIGILGCMDIILFCICIRHIVTNLQHRVKKPGNASIKDTIKRFGAMQWIGIVVELFDCITDYIYATDLILISATAVLGWLSLIVSVLGLVLFLLKYSLFRKLFGHQIGEYQDKLNDSASDQTDIMNEIRVRHLDLDVISLLNGVIEDVPQAMIVIIVTSNIGFNIISILSITMSMISFTLKLGQIIMAQLGCKDPVTPAVQTQQTEQTDVVELS